jgi:hypothetical protein
VRSSLDDFEGTELVGVFNALAESGLRPTGDLMQLMLGAVLNHIGGQCRIVGTWCYPESYRRSVKDSWH